jgi:hypothetical protein
MVFILFVTIRGAVKKFPEFFYIYCLAHHEFISPGQCYWSFLRASSAVVVRYISEEEARHWQAWTAAPASQHSEPHFACCGTVPVIIQPPCSPDLAPSDF